MDPASAIGVAAVACTIAKRAWDIGEGLYLFLRDVKQLDSVASGFVGEIKGLSAACRIVGTRLESIVKEQDARQSVNSTSDDTGLLWTYLEGQVHEVQATVEQLQQAVGFLRTEPGKETNFWNQATRQIKLNMKTRNIGESRNRIRSHTASLNIMLQAIAIEVAYVAPQRADQQLRTQLAALAGTKQELEDLRAQREPDAGSPQCKMEDDVLRASDQVITSGETLYAASVAGGSVLGEVTVGKQRSIFEWIEAANAIDRIDSATTTTNETRNPSIFSVSRGDAPDLTEVTSQSTEPRLVDPQDLESPFTDKEDDDVGSEDGYILDAAQEAIQSGREAFKSKDYQDASILLEEALQLVRELSMSRQNKVCDPSEMRYMLGVCAFHSQLPATAEIALLTIINDTPKARVQDDTRKLQVCDAGHLLSQTYLKLGNLDQANFYCKNALRGRQRLLGKENESSFESLALMARIISLQGNTARATIFAKTIPEPARNQLLEKFKDLGGQIRVNNHLAQHRKSQDVKPAISEKPIHTTPQHPPLPGALGIAKEMAVSTDSVVANLKGLSLPRQDSVASSVELTSEPALTGPTHPTSSGRVKIVLLIGDPQVRETSKLRSWMWHNWWSVDFRLDDQPRQRHSYSTSTRYSLEVGDESSMSFKVHCSGKLNFKEVTFKLADQMYLHTYRPVKITLPLEVADSKVSGQLPLTLFSVH